MCVPPHHLTTLNPTGIQWPNVNQCNFMQGQTTQNSIETPSVGPMPGQMIYRRLINPMQGQTASVNPCYQFGFNTTIDMIMLLFFTMLLQALLTLGT